MSAYSFWFQTLSRNYDDVHGHPGRLISSGVAKNYRAADRFPRLSTVWIGSSNKSKDETAGTRFGAKWQRSSWPQEEPYASDLGAQIILERPISVRRDGVFDHLGEKRLCVIPHSHIFGACRCYCVGACRCFYADACCFCVGVCYHLREAQLARENVARAEAVSTDKRTGHRASSAACLEVLD